MQHQTKLGARVMKLVAGATVVGAALVSQTAYAAVVTVDFSSNPFSVVPFNIDGVYVNIASGAAGATGVSTPGWDVNLYFTGSALPPAALRFFTPSGGGMVGASGAASVLAAGATVGPASTFLTGSNVLGNALGTNTFGFRFTNDTTGVINYGYLIVAQAVNPPVAGAVQLLSFSYDNTGAAIAVVPEPSTWLLMLGGLAAVGATLRKRAAA